VGLEADHHSLLARHVRDAAEVITEQAGLAVDLGGFFALEREAASVEHLGLQRSRDPKRLFQLARALLRQQVRRAADRRDPEVAQLGFVREFLHLEVIQLVQRFEELGLGEVDRKLFEARPDNGVHRGIERGEAEVERGQLCYHLAPTFG